MPDSISSEEDPRFRIPRGSSDEEIDSDLASCPSSPPPASIDALPGGKPRAAKPSRQSVTKTTAILTAGLPSFASPSLSSAPLPEDEDGEDGEDGEDADDGNISKPTSDALSNITSAATRRNLTHAASRKVDPSTTAGPPTTPAVSSTQAPSHSDMINRILNTLRTTSTTERRASKSLPELQKKIERLHDGEKKHLSVPLSAPVSARLERSAAYKQTGHLLSDKWGDTVEKNRLADKLQFPLNEPLSVRKSTTDLTSRPPAYSRTAQDHEREIADILREAGVSSDKGVVNTETKAIDDAIQAGKASKEDVQARHRELARVRSLVFHYDQKMKRIKKIKSKKFRKVMKKEREKLAEAHAELYPEDEREEELAAERRRVEERVTLRHKNTSKWIRRQLQRGEAKRDDSTKNAIEDQLRLHEQLKRRQLREVGNGGSDADDDSDDNSGGREDEELAQLEKQLQDGGPDGSKGARKKGIMSLRFMQAAEERKRKEALDLLNEMKERSEDDEQETGNEKVVGRNTFLGTEQSEQTKKSKARRKRRESNALSTGPHVNGLENDNDNAIEAEQLERRLREEYEAAAENGAIGDKTNGLVDVETAADAIKEAKESTKLFTSRLEGRLTADVNTDGLDNVSCGSLGTATKGKGGTKELKRKSVDEHVDPTVDRAIADNPWLSGTCAEGGMKAGSRVGKSIKKDEKNVVEGQGGCEVESPPKSKRQRKNKKGAARAIVSVDGQASGNGGGSKTVENIASISKDEKNIMEASGGCEVKSRHESKKQRKNSKAVTKATEAVGGKASGNINGSQSVEHVANVVDGSGKGEGDNDEEASAKARMEEVALAFAGAGGADLAEFEAAKEAEIEENLPTAKSINAETLPGWGHWDGAGISQKTKKRKHESAFARAARERLDEARENAIKSRSDKKSRHVILEQRRVESAVKLTMGSVPYPYQSKEQWERELSRPLCREFVSSVSFNRDVQRRVDTTLGRAIKALQTPASTIGAAKNEQLVNRGPHNNKSGKKEVNRGPQNKKSGKKDIIDLRKGKASHRVKARRGLLS